LKAFVAPVVMADGGRNNTGCGRIVARTSPYFSTFTGKKKYSLWLLNH
jgi:hypothetical protein